MMNNRGQSLEAEVFDLLALLEPTGFVRDLSRNVRLSDVNGVDREVDILATFRTHLFELKVAIEIKYRARGINLQDIDQIRLLREALRPVNLFWFVYQGALSARARRSLEANGIVAFSIEEFSRLIDRVLQNWSKCKEEIERAREFEMFISGMQCSTDDWKRWLRLHEEERICMKPLGDLYEQLGILGDDYRAGRKL